MHYRNVGAICPSWQSAKGYKMALAPASGVGVIIKSTTACLWIKPGSDDDHWEVTWSVDHGSSNIRGAHCFSQQDLRRAFGIEDGHRQDPYIKNLNRIAGTICDAACPGAYYRYGQFLNIPGPGTGVQGDPNISIVLDEEIVEAVRNLLAMPSRKPRAATA